MDTVVNATQGITLTQVLLNNQADFSGTHPMLRQCQGCKKED
jgi:hypothetical protein